MVLKMIINKKKPQEETKNNRKILEQYFMNLPEDLNFHLLCESSCFDFTQKVIFWVEYIAISEIKVPAPGKKTILQMLRSVLIKIRSMTHGFDKNKNGF